MNKDEQDFAAGRRLGKTATSAMLHRHQASKARELINRILFWLMPIWVGEVIRKRTGHVLTQSRDSETKKVIETWWAYKEEHKQ